jgi:hypothetical protein
MLGKRDHHYLYLYGLVEPFLKLLALLLPSYIKGNVYLNDASGL